MKISQTKQYEVIRHVMDTFNEYEEQMTTYRERMMRIYRECSTFSVLRANPWDTTFKVNKPFEIINKKLPKIYSSARTVKWLVSYKSDDHIDEINKSIAWLDGQLATTVVKEKQATIKDMADAIKDKLYDIFERKQLKEVLRLWAKAGITFGIWWAKVETQYEMVRSPKKEIWVEYDEFGNQVEVVNKKVEEKVSKSYPCIVNKSWTDMYYDPRYLRLEDMPSVIDVTRNVRLSYFTKNKDDFMNVDQIVEMRGLQRDDPQWFRQRVLAIHGENTNTDIDMSKLDVKCFYWYFDMSEEDDRRNEKLYEFWTINDCVLVKAEEITQIPYEDFRVFEDTEQFFATGYVEAILWLTDELNYKKNMASQYINQWINRSWIVWANSWIDPRKLNGWAGNILLSRLDAQTTLANIQEIPHRQIPSDYFQEQNDFERQIQALSFSIDTSTPNTQQALTNTATGAKIQANITDWVDDEVRNHFEEAMIKIAYKMLQKEFDSGDDIMTYKKQWSDEFRAVNKELMREALEKYDIKIQVWSSAFDSVDNRRNEAIAVWNILKDGKMSWLPINLKKWFESVIDSFEWLDKEAIFEQVMPWMWQSLHQSTPTGSIPMIPTWPASQ